MVKFTIDKSPFKFERNYNAKNISKSFRLPEDVYNEIMKYYDSIHGESNNLTKAFNSIAIEKLDNICRERKSFQDLNILMLIPESDDVEVLNKESKIIGFFTIDDVSKLNQELLVRDESDDEIMIKHNLARSTIKESYDIIQFINPKCFDFNMNDVSSFDDFKIRLNKAYPRIDLSKAYIVQVELNNYFDIYRDGEFQSYMLNNLHMGAYVFFDYELEGDIARNRKLYCFIRWNYNSNVLNIDFNFVSNAHFFNSFKEDDKVDNKAINDEINFILNDEDRKKTLLEMKDNLKQISDDIYEQLDYVYTILEKEYPEVFDD